MQKCILLGNLYDCLFSMLLFLQGLLSQYRCLVTKLKKQMQKIETSKSLLGSQKLWTKQKSFKRKQMKLEDE